MIFLIGFKKRPMVPVFHPPSIVDPRSTNHKCIYTDETLSKCRPGQFFLRNVNPKQSISIFKGYLRDVNPMILKDSFPGFTPISPSESNELFTQMTHYAQIFAPFRRKGFGSAPRASDSLYPVETQKGFYKRHFLVTLETKHFYETNSNTFLVILTIVFRYTLG